MSTKFTSKELHKAMFNNTVVVKPEPLHILPTKHCHDNCDVFAEVFNARVVRGFIIVKHNFGYLYNHHSIVELDGNFVDVTAPQTNNKLLGFIEDKKNSDDMMYENILHYKKHKKKKGIFKDEAYHSIPNTGLVPISKSDTDLIAYAPITPASEQSKAIRLAMLAKFAYEMQQEAA